MHTTLLLAGAVFTTAVVEAAEPTRELDEALAVKLINLQSRHRTPQIQVAMVLEGSSRTGPFETRHVSRVLAVHPVIEEGRQVRRAHCYDFHWNERYGWFTWEQRQERGGDAVWIWSELLGEVVVR